MTRLGAAFLEGMLAADRGHRGQRVACGAGHHATFAGYRPKCLDTVLGPIVVRRAYYHCARCGHGVAPRDAELGVADASLSPGLRAMVARAGAAVPFARARELLAELAGVTLTTKRVERSAEADGATVAAAIATEAAAVLAGEVVPLAPDGPPAKLYIAIDGTGVPTVPADTVGRTGKAADGRARTREVKLGVLFTQTRLDAQGRPERDVGSSSYVASFEPAANFGTLLYAEALRRGAQRARPLVVLGDGAPWIWNLAAEHFPGATQIVDLYHAREHLHALGSLVAPALDDPRRWLDARLADLDRGDMSALLAATRALKLAGATTHEVEKALAYFETNAERMRYAAFREAGHFVGSGAVEAGCKAVIGQRLKLSGMRWSVRGATGIIALRCHEASARWNDIWSRIHNQTSAA